MEAQGQQPRVLDGHLLLNDRLRVIWADSRCHELLGRQSDREPLIGMELTEITPFIDALGISEGMRRLAETGEEYHGLNVSLARPDCDGEQWCWSGYQLPDGNLLLAVLKLSATCCR